MHRQQADPKPIFTALHGMQTRSSDKNSACLSVRLSVKRLIFDKTKKVVPAFLYHTKDHLPYFCDRMVGGATPFT